MYSVPSSLASNDFIIELIKRENPFSIIRLGTEAHAVYDFAIGRQKYRCASLPNNAGIYWSNKEDLTKYLFMYNDAIRFSDGIVALGDSRWNTVQSYFISQYKLSPIHSRSVESFYYVHDKVTPWTHYLLGKRVLVINPFVVSFKRQLDRGFSMFQEGHLQMFQKNQEFVFYKSFQTAAGNRLHSSWIETFNIMCEDIKKMDFDIALLGCGGYGLPLCDYIKRKLNKSAIYVGGGIQLMFGVMGRRWENLEFWRRIIKENKTRFVRPNEDEALPNSTRVEMSCYW